MFDEPVRVALLAGLLGAIMELLAAVISWRPVRRVLYAGSLAVSAFALSAGVVAAPDVTAVLSVLVLIYRGLNMLRVVSGRMKEVRLQRVSRRTSFWMIAYQLVALGLWTMSYKNGITAGTWLYVCVVVAALSTGIMLLALRQNLRRTRLRSTDKYTPDTELPTVSVCIPARNETADLPSCLESILANDYPKLEVLVLDDCSQDKTSDVIKSFAQRGVRFIKGEPPRQGWLAKNQAYDVLAESASGSILLFCGVDTRFEPKAIRAMVGTMIARKKSMLSVLPKGLQVHEHAVFVQPMRYWWELALPRRLFNRPPVLSTVWMIRKAEMQRLGGMKAVNNTVVPEGYFARELTKTDAYSFLRVGGTLMIGTNKQFEDQWQTSIRTRYPQLRKRPENVFLLTLAELMVFMVPLVLFVVGFIVPMGLVWTLAGLVVLGLVYIHYLIIKAWSLEKLMLPLATFPAAAAMELAITNISLWQYEFGEVTWKERNICIPVMHVVAHLPKVE